MSRRRPWWALRDQPDADEDLNEPAEGRVRVPTRIDPLTGEAVESVYAEPGAADDWDARVWRRDP